MVLMALGLNHQTAPIQIREKLAFSELEAREFICDLRQEGIVEEAVLVSTCNRTELYCQTKAKPLALSRLIRHGLPYTELSWSEVRPYFYHHLDDMAVKHLFRVVSGLDSMVLGEVEILGQIKTAYRLALNAGTLGRNLDRLFQFSFSVAKQVRTDTEIGVNPLSLAAISVRLADRIFSRLTDATVLLIGAGQLIRSVLLHLQNSGVRKIFLANRSSGDTQYLKEKYGVEVMSLQSISDRLSEADIVISGTASELPILGKGMVERALKVRKHRPIYMVDLAVPRDIEPEVGTLEDVYLYNLDDLQKMINQNYHCRKNAAKYAEDIVQQETEQFMGWMRSEKAFSAIGALRKKAERLEADVLEKAFLQLQLGKSPNIVLQHALHSLKNQLLHEPVTRLRQAGFFEENELLYHTQQLFNLHEI